MKCVLLVSIAMGSVYCEGPVFVQELEALVKTKNEKLELRSLAENKYMIRSEKARRLKAILSRLPKDVQKKYEKAVSDEKKKMRERLTQQNALAKKWGYAALLSKVEAIDRDMSISDAEADRREEELIKSLTPNQRRDYDELRKGKGKKGKAKEKKKTGNDCKSSIVLTILTSCAFLFY